MPTAGDWTTDALRLQAVRESIQPVFERQLRVSCARSLVGLTTIAKCRMERCRVDFHPETGIEDLRQLLKRVPADPLRCTVWAHPPPGMYYQHNNQDQWVRKRGPQRVLVRAPRPQSKSRDCSSATCRNWKLNVTISKRPNDWNKGRAPP